MVARTSTAKRLIGTLIARLERGFERLLSVGSAAVSAISRDTHSVREGDARMLGNLAVLVLGVVCLLAGGLARLALAGGGSERASAAIAVAAALLWAPARLLVMALVLRSSPVERTLLRGAWAASLVPWLLAIGPITALGAWGLSGWLCYRALAWAGERPRSAGVAVAVAWGAQGLAGVLGWLALNALFAILLSRT